VGKHNFHVGLYRVPTNARTTRGKALPDNHTNFLWNEKGEVGPDIKHRRLILLMKWQRLTIQLYTNGTLFIYLLLTYSSPCWSAIGCHVRNGFSCVLEVPQRFPKVLQVLGEEVASSTRREEESRSSCA
jgi:hypothetical protein